MTPEQAEAIEAVRVAVAESMGADPADVSMAVTIRPPCVRCGVAEAPVDGAGVCLYCREEPLEGDRADAPVCSWCGRTGCSCSSEPWA